MFRMPIGLYEKALPADLSWEEKLATAGQAGYDFVEISIDESSERLSRLDWGAPQRIQLRHAIEKSGVKIMTMCLSASRKYPLGSNYPDLRHQAQEIIRKAIEFAGDIGLRVVQIMAYDVFYEPSDETTRNNFLCGLDLATKWASQAGVMLGIENLDTPFADHIEKTLEIMHVFNSPWLHLYPDIGNLAAAGYSPVEELKRAEGHILGIHVKDATPKVIRGVPYGEGIVPFGQVFHALSEMGFNGLLSAEMWGHLHPDKDPLDGATRIHKFIQNLVSEAWPDNKVI